MKQELKSFFKKAPMMYFVLILSIIFAIFASSLITTSLGMNLGSVWMIVCGGIVRVILTAALFFLTAPAIIPVLVIFGRRVAGKYISIAKGICVAEILATLIFAVFLKPIRENLALLPILIILIMGIYAIGGITLKKKTVGWLLTLSLVVLFAYMIFPAPFEKLFWEKNKLNNEMIMERLEPTIAEMDANPNIFINKKTGEIICFYIINLSGEVELYNYEGYHSSLFEKVEPATRKIIQLYRKQQANREDAKKKVQKEAARKKIEQAAEAARHQLAVAILRDDQRAVIDPGPLMSILRAKGISVIDLPGSYSSLSGLSDVNVGDFSKNSGAKYILIGKVELSIRPNNISGQGSSYSGDANINYRLYSRDGKKLSHSSSSGASVGLASESAKNRAIDSALKRLGNRIYPRIQ